MYIIKKKWAGRRETTGGRQINCVVLRLKMDVCLKGGEESQGRREVRVDKRWMEKVATTALHNWEGSEADAHPSTFPSFVLSFAC
jgi:hypothetical protein